MNLKPLFEKLADAFNGAEPIERVAAVALRSADCANVALAEGVPLPRPFVVVMSRPDAHPSCRDILEIPFNWAPPATSKDPKYQLTGKAKVHVELIGPEGLVRSDHVRLGLYGILPKSEYGVRTHPAEEVFVMLAGQAFWKR